LSEIEDRLRVAMQDAVADEEMPSHLVGLVMRRQRRRRALAAGVAVLAALIVAVPGAIAWRDGQTAVPQHATLAARILRAASVAVGRAPVTAEPSARQWIYAQSVHYEYNTGNLAPGCRFVSSGGKPGDTQECAEWTRFDGNATAYWQGRHLVVTTNSTPWPAEKKGDLLLGPFNSPEAAYAAMASLPKNPHALLAAVDKAAKALGPILVVLPGRGSSLAGAYLMMLLWEAGGVGPPEGEAAVFQAMAALPGVKVQQGITDIAGAQAIGVSAGGYEQLLLDPVSYQVIGLREFNPIGGPKPGWPRHGALIISSAYTQVREVSGPGIR
jgi:hypothetical protein